ncbi:AglZ/HisF2 family acetamidino modification protein [Sediminibacterium sp.]|uniref:AglZ/HisF2 family acetamidino modification protein n=1 Tax=Sediminibacterium sp. TaxID=1917865 RepID=UPI0025DD374F|nr:AglZ/HisF2 family acetamidino modification protein [Sediminibacterium sp.]
MLKPRVIPVLLLRNQGLVKTVKFDKHVYVGDPINAIKIFNEKEVDELVFLDIDASKKGGKPNFSIIGQIATECFMPVCYGGGISDIESIRKILKLGIEKVSLNASAINSLDFIKSAVTTFGSSTIVISIDIKKSLLGKPLVFDHRTGKTLNKDLFDYIHELEKCGVGELLINSVDKDGTMSGYDIVLIEKISRQVNIPVIVCGGASNLSDFKSAIKVGASAVGAGSLFVFHGKHKAVLITYPNTEELSELIK